MRLMLKSLVHRHVALATFGLTVLFCPLLNASPAQSAELTLAIADLPAFSSALVAESEGYFAAEGLPLKVIHCANGKRCLKHLLDGEAHFATVADAPLVLASFETRAFSIVATIATTARENRLIARADRGIRTPADLKGKRIGTVLGTSGQYFTDTFLMYYGIAPSQVTVVGLDASTAHEALKRGEVDAVGLYQPHGYLTQASLGTNALVLPSPKVFTASINLVSVSATAGGRDEDIVKLLRALQRANGLIATDPERARRIVATRLKLAPQLLEAIWDGYDHQLHLGQPLVTGLEAQARWALRAGLVPRQAVPDYLDFIRTSPLRVVDRTTVTLVK